MNCLGQGLLGRDLMNDLGAEPARYQPGNHNFLSNIEFNLECPPFPAGIPVGEGGYGD